jgi:hypothetical protein
MTRFLLSLAACALLVVAMAARSAAQTTATANPELVGALVKELGTTPKQAEGAAGSLFSAARSRLKPGDWSKIAAAVPGMDGMLKAAPAATGVGGQIPGVANFPGGGASSLGSLAGVASSFTKLGLQPDMVAKAIPILTSYVTKTGGADIGSLLASALK